MYFRKVKNKDGEGSKKTSNKVLVFGKNNNLIEIKKQKYNKIA